MRVSAAIHIATWLLVFSPSSLWAQGVAEETEPGAAPEPGSDSATSEETPSDDGTVESSDSADEGGVDETDGEDPEAADSPEEEATPESEAEAESGAEEAPAAEEDSSASVTEAEKEPTEGSDTDPAPPSAPAIVESSAASGDDEVDDYDADEEPKEERWREKPLRTTVGIPPTQRDLGNEADIFIDDEDKIEQKSKEWKIDIKAFLRGTARASYGPRNDGEPGYELHAPARIPGLSSGNWEHIGLVPNPSAKAYFSAGTPTISANVILGGQPPIDEGFANPGEAGWFLDAYVALKFPRAFDNKGGIALTAGSFSHRYGNAGVKSTGYYRTYMFGKTHVAGGVATADYDLTKDWEVLLEGGFGAKSEAMPWMDPSDPGRPDADYLPGQGDLPRGSNFVGHGHLQFRHNYWLRVGGHFLESWTPNDNSLLEDERAEGGRLRVSGVEANVDLSTGNGYLGYSHMNAQNVIALSNGVAVLHAAQGTDFKKVYFGERDRVTGEQPSNDSGTVDTVLFQYIWKLGNILRIGPDFDVGLFGMFAHVNSPIEDPSITTQENIKYSRLKWGTEVQYELLPFMRGALRFDYVDTDMTVQGDAFQTISPRLFFFTKKGSKEYVVANFSYFFYGPEVYPGSPYRNLDVPPDPFFFGLSAVMSL